MITMSAKPSIIAAVLLAGSSAASAVGLSEGVGPVTLPDANPGLTAGSGTTIATEELIPQTVDAGRSLEMSAAEAVRQAREAYGGKVLSVTQVGTGANAHYRIMLLSDGNVHIVRIPPQEGNTDARPAD